MDEIAAKIADLKLARATAIAKAKDKAWEELRFILNEEPWGWSFIDSP